MITSLPLRRMDYDYPVWSKIRVKVNRPAANSIGGMEEGKNKPAIWGDALIEVGADANSGGENEKTI